MITFGFALAFSRGGAVGLACLVAAMLCLRTIDARKALLLAAAVGLTLAAVPQYLQRMRTMVTSVVALEQDARSADSSVRRRLTVMLAAAHLFLDHPLIGVGPGMFLVHSEEVGNQNALRRLRWGRRAHCLYLEVAAENGALGLGLFLGAVAVTARRLARGRRVCRGRDPELSETCTGFLLALIAYMATALFLHLSYVRYFFLLLAMSDAAAQAALAPRGLTADARARPALLPTGAPA
jgi:O-antigen ligase